MEVPFNASKDDVSLCAAVVPRFMDTCDLYAKTHGEQYKFTKEEEDNVRLWRTALDRMSRGDFRITASELKAVQAVAQWTVDVYGKLRNQDPRKIVWA